MSLVQTASPRAAGWRAWLNQGLAPLTAWGAALVALAAVVLDVGDRGGFFVPAFRRLLREDRGLVAPLLMSGALGLAFVQAPERVRGACRWIARHPRAVATLVSLLCLAISEVSFERRPLSMDEIAPLFQARVFAEGDLAARFRPDQLSWLFPPGFLGSFYFVQRETGQVISAYWPGFALLLTPLELLGLGSVLNPLLAGGSTLLTRYVALRLTDGDEEATGAAMLLLLASAAFLLTGASFYSMNAHLCANLAFVALLSAPTHRRLCAAGAVGALALSLHNPLPHLLFAWPWWLLQLREPDRLRRCASLAAGYVPVGLLLVVGWYALSQSLREQGAALVGASALSKPSVEVLLVRAQGLAKLVLWSPFALVPMAVAGAFRWRQKRLAQGLSLSALSLLVGYAFVKFDQGHGWGYRYFHPAYATLPLLAAGSIAGAGGLRAALVKATIGWSLLSLLLLVPGRVLSARSFAATHRAQLVSRAAVSVATAAECVHVVGNRAMNAGDLIANDPYLRGDLFLFDHGPRALEELRARHFPNTRLIAQTRLDSLWCGDLGQYKSFARRGSLPSPPTTVLR